MTWGKIDTGLHRNPKIRMAGADAREVFLYIVLANAEQSADGVLAGHYANPAFLADALQRDEETVCNALKRCVTFHLLHVTNDEVSIVGWDSEWRTKSSTDRVRKHRERKKLQEVEPVKRSSNVPERFSNACNTPEREIERDERKRERGAQKHALPQSWQPNEKHIAKADENRLHIEEEAEKFRDHHEAKGSKMVKWDSAFNTWLRNAVKFGAEREAKQPRGPVERML